jgi:predicted nucleotidyltransferase
MLEKLFTSKNRIKILNFFLFKKTESHIREIARELKIPVSAVKRETDNLLLIGILKQEKRSITLNKKCNFLEDLKNIFIKTDSIIYPIQETLGKTKANFIFLFGSFARGEYQEESDIDLMVISKIKSFDLYKKVRPAEDIIKRDINPVVWTLETLKKEKDSGFIRDIFKKGIIMIKGDENELRKIVK